MANCAAISGATAQVYTLVSGDAGSRLMVSVTASSASGSAVANSAPTATVQTSVTAVTLGKTSIGATPDSFAADRKRVNSYALATAGTVSKLTVYLAPSGAAGQQVLKGVIYADASGTPGSLLASANELAFSGSQGAGWFDLPLARPLPVSPGRYWIGVLTGSTGGVAGFRYDSVAGSRTYNANPYTSGPSNPFGSFSTDSEQMSLYATVSTMRIRRPRLNPPGSWPRPPAPLRSTCPGRRRATTSAWPATRSLATAR